MPELEDARREKETYVRGLFASVASRYDYLNTVMSLGRHRGWRRFALRQAGLKAGSKALDVAAGTADFTLEQLKVVGPTGIAVGVDFCLPMLQLGSQKLRRAGWEQPGLVEANAAELPFPDDFFDCATIGFALRNVADVRETLAEMVRVVRPGGRVVSLEILGAESPLVLPIWRFYFNRLVPMVTRLLGGRKEAYRYLPESVKRFCTRQELEIIMQDCGLIDTRVWGFALGSVCVHVGTKG